MPIYIFILNFEGLFAFFLFPCIHCKLAKFLISKGRIIVSHKFETVVTERNRSFATTEKKTVISGAFLRLL